MKKNADNIELEILVKDYLELNSVYRVADKHNVSATAVKRLLKEARVLRTQSEAAKIRNLKNEEFRKFIKADKSQECKLKISQKKMGGTPWNKGKTGIYSEEALKKLSDLCKSRIGMMNPNYKDGKSIRRPRDFKYFEFKPVRKQCFNRDNYTCKYCKKYSGKLHAHHILPYWVRPEAFLDMDNLVTVCSDCHFNKAHKGNWATFDVELANQDLLNKYSLSVERLNVLANLEPNRLDAIV